MDSEMYKNHFYENAISFRSLHFQKQNKKHEMQQALFKKQIRTNPDFRLIMKRKKALHVTLLRLNAKRSINDNMLVLIEIEIHKMINGHTRYQIKRIKNSEAYIYLEKKLQKHNLKAFKLQNKINEEEIYFNQLSEEENTLMKNLSTITWTL
jgi:hypothetical protein